VEYDGMAFCPGIIIASSRRNQPIILTPSGLHETPRSRSGELMSATGESQLGLLMGKTFGITMVSICDHLHRFGYHLQLYTGARDD